MQRDRPEVAKYWRGYAGRSEEGVVCLTLFPPEGNGPISARWSVKGLRGRGCVSRLLFPNAYDSPISTSFKSISAQKKRTRSGSLVFSGLESFEVVRWRNLILVVMAVDNQMTDRRISLCNHFEFQIVP